MFSTGLISTFVIMMWKVFNLAFCIIFSCVGLHAQITQLELQIVDAESKSPIEGVHLFIENTTIGCFSDQDGLATLQIPSSVTGDLFITHIAYLTTSYTAKNYRAFSREHSIYLNQNAVELPELTVEAKKDNKWKKRYKKFLQGFLGKDEIAKQCKILNPEVIWFEETDGILHAYALDLIQIENPHLAYKIYYFLNGFEMTKDGSTLYSGRSRFLDISTPDNWDFIHKNRETLYSNSSKRFFKSLISNQLEEDGFKVEMVDYKGGQFHKINDFNRDNHFKGPSQSGKYTVAFDEFLNIYNVNSKAISVSGETMRLSGLEGQRFNANREEKKESVVFNKSQLYKVAPYIILNEHGNVVNSQHVKEYGFWAEQKMAKQLPFDYGNQYSDKIIESISKAEIENSKHDQDAIFQWFYKLLYGTDNKQKTAILDEMKNNWSDSFTPPLIELIRLSNDQLLVNQINSLLQERFEQSHVVFYDWVQWLWQKDINNEDFYFKFKSELYKNIDPVFYSYFKNRKEQSIIRLDEVLWGGVKQDGIPPLRMPKLLSVDEASYLNDSDIVFGFYINGIAKAYPKRILAWHEFFTDDFDGIKIAGVYCTLCGTVIAYNMIHNNTFHDLGTSGFLYRSNKLMYDKATQSLWSTIEGKPVIGPLTGKGIELESYSLVTTDWKSWKSLHPDTKVLSLETGHNRDYDEGAAYRSYFATDELMFPVINIDTRLNNKDEVIVVRQGNYKQDPIAISIDYLQRKKWHQDKIGELNFIVLSDNSGAARAYHSNNIRFKSFKKNILTDESGGQWKVEEEYLIAPTGKTLARLPSHNIFWFAWYNTYPNTRLIK